MAYSMTLRAPSKERKPLVTRKSATVDPAEVARVAYELFQDRGGVHGYDVQDWIEAEQIVRQRQS